jgi:hypothetical protein
MLTSDIGRDWAPSHIIDAPSIVADAPGRTCRSARPSRHDGRCRFVCAVPRDAEEFDTLHTLEQDLFGDGAFPSDVAHEIFAMRPEIFSGVFDRNGNVVAYTSGFFLRPEWGTALIRGDIIDLDIRPHMMYRRNDCHTGVYVYLGSVVVDPKCDPILKGMLLASLMWFRVHQMRSAAVERLSAIMTTVSREGERLARRIGAQKLNDRANRKDGRDIFGCELSPKLLGCAMETFPFAKTVAMDLNFPSFAGVN